MSFATPHFLETLKRRWRSARLGRQEISGSLGDLGLFIPLLVGVTTTCGLNFAVALFFAGLFNVVTGLLFEIPMAVQPMKAIAAVAITEKLAAPQILAAGIITGAVIFFLGVTHLLGAVMRLVPKSVVRGIQLSVGLTLMLQAVQMAAQNRPWLGADSISAAVAGLLFLFVAFRRAWPGALWIFFAGLAVAAAHPSAVADLRFGFGSLALPAFTAPDFWLAARKAALPQIPVTCLNSVIAVCALSRDLFPEKPASEKSVAVSVGLMNLIACPFGAMPMCHGAGGLAGQYRFGARTNGSILFLGAMKMLVAVCFGGSLLTLLQVYPQSLLGVLLFFAGLELALVCRDIFSEREPAIIMLLTAVVGVALKSAALGFGGGLALHYFLKLSEPRAEK